MSLVPALIAAARGEDPDAALEALAVEALRAQVSRKEILMACQAARMELDDEEPAEDSMLELMDRLSGWCSPDRKI